MNFQIGTFQHWDGHIGLTKKMEALKMMLYLLIGQQSIGGGAHENSIEACKHIHTFKDARKKKTI